MNPLVIIAGPTAVGKSDFAVKLAKVINGEIISADSMQVYKGMDIGSAKITKDEMQGINHYLIDVLDPFEDFNVAVFQSMAKEAANLIISKGKIPILCGGTGFYIQSLLYGIDFDESQGTDPSFRKTVEDRIENEGIDSVYDELMSVDPEACAYIHKNNTMRVVRALSFFYETGKKISEHNKDQHNKKPVFNAAYFVLNDERGKIYERIDKRVDKMLENGLIDEVTSLKARGLSTSNISMLGLGYKEIMAYLDKEISFEEAVYRIKRDSRHFAKRQLTWLRREKEVIWLNKQDFDYSDERLMAFVLEQLKEKNII